MHSAICLHILVHLSDTGPMNEIIASSHEERHIYRKCISTNMCLTVSKGNRLEKYLNIICKSKVVWQISIEITQKKINKIIIKTKK